MDKLLIKPEYLKILTDIFNSYCPFSVVVAYGSRLNGNAHEGSDLDLAIKFNQDDKHIYELRNIINDSDIPFLVDIHEYESLPDTFKEEILKNYIVIYKNN